MQSRYQGPRGSNNNGPRGYNDRGPPRDSGGGRHDSNAQPHFSPGTKSQQLVVSTNCFSITKVPTEPYVMYDVSFLPEIRKGSWRKKAELVRHLQVMVEPEVFTPQFLYDGEAVGFAHPLTCGRLPRLASSAFGWATMACPAKMRRVSM
ncbi:hypothetical protein DFP72DRAFT_869867 [Ephemerocybe angulata]|uniref:Uncharacterized protein n=1 Tax=Ephemerocybe angulata TaxID=980116 RepID=A0A8H6MDY8_9AGAR|nr:hypothetical protein DFP72DRAFT_869867 [Tulosesus angulatus]